MRLRLDLVEVGWPLVTDIAFLLLRLIIILRFGAKNRVDCEDRTLFTIRQREFEWRHALEALTHVRYGEGLDLHFVFTLHCWQLGHEFAQVGLETRVVEGATKALSDSFTYLRVSILLGSPLALLRTVDGTICRRSMTIFADLGTQILLVQFLLVLEDLLRQALRQIAPLAIFVEHVREALLHLSLNVECLFLHIFHLLLDCRDALLQNCRVKDACIGEHRTHVTALHHSRLATCRSSSCERMLLHHHNLL